MNGGIARVQHNRVLVIADVAGSGLHYHAGDEAMAIVAIERLSALVGRANLVLACPHPRTAGTAYGLRAIAMPMHTPKTWLMHCLFLPFYSWWLAGRLLWHLHHADFVFKAGGGNMRGRETKFPLLTFVRWWRKPLFLVSQTIGPLSGNHRAYLRRQLAEAAWIGVRDRTFSRDQLGLSVHFAPDDAVFLEPRHDSLTADLINEGRTMIGLSYHYCGSSGLIAPLLAATEDVALNLEAVPVFIPHLAHGRHGDQMIARLIRDEFRRAKPIAIKDVPPAPAILALTGGFALVLASRYHGIVFALAAGIPAVGIYYDAYSEAKMRGVFEQFGLEPQVIRIDQAGRELGRVVERALAAQTAFVKAATAIRKQKLADSMAPYEFLRTSIGIRNRAGESGLAGTNGG